MSRTARKWTDFHKTCREALAEAARSGHASFHLPSLRDAHSRRRDFHRFFNALRSDLDDKSPERIALALTASDVIVSMEPQPDGSALIIIKRNPMAVAMDGKKSTFIQPQHAAGATKVDTIGTNGDAKRIDALARRHPALLERFLTNELTLEEAEGLAASQNAAE